MQDQVKMSGIVTPMGIAQSDTDSPLIWKQPYYIHPVDLADVPDHTPYSSCTQYHALVNGSPPHYNGELALVEPYSLLNAQQSSNRQKKR